MSRTLHDFWIFSGTANKPFAQAVCDYLDMPLGDAKVNTFSDGESQVEINDNVRTKDAFVIQATSKPVNHHLMELLVMIDALKRASASSITAVLPYYGYARQDKKVKPRVPITAKLVADLLTSAGAGRVITLDLHAAQIQGFFNIPVDNLFARPVLVRHIRSNFKDNLVLVSPDAGGVERTRSFAKILNAGLAIVDKRRNEPNVAKALNLIGDVKDKIAIILDDMADTCGTLTEATGLLIEKGALEVHAYCTHPVLSGPAIKRLEESPLKSLVVTDSIALNKRTNKCGKIKVVSVAQLIAEAISRSHYGESVTSLF